jgi:uncharacterized membrane protein
MLLLLPMSLFMAACFTTDTLTNGFSFLWIAMVLRLALDQERPIRKQDWAILALLLIPLALSKSIYILLVFFVFLIPLLRRNRWRSSFLIGIGFVTAAACIGLVWLNYVNQTTSSGLSAANGDRLAYFLHSPLKAANIFWMTLVKDGLNQIQMYIGVLGWADTPLSGWVYPLAFLSLLAVAIFNGTKRYKIGWLGKLLSFALSIGFILSLLFLFFSPGVSVGNGVISGIQGRYLIPFGVLFFLPLYNQKFALPEDAPVWRAAAVISVLLLAAALRALLWRYYAI